MTQLMIYGAVKIEQKRHEFTDTATCPKFHNLEFLITDEDGRKTTISVLSAEELHFPSKTDLAGELFALGVAMNRARAEELT